jgi:hypothetical protein
MLKIAKYFNSLQYVVMCIVLFQVMLVIDTATLLYHSFPVLMHPALRLIASAFGSVTIEAFLLMISVNMYLLRHRFGQNALPITFGFFSAIMTLFFMEAFDTTATTIVICMRFFVALVFGLINYLLSEVFIKKWDEYQQTLTTCDQLQIDHDRLLENEEIMRKNAKDLEYELQALHTENVQLKSLNHDQLVSDHEQLLTAHDLLLTKHHQNMSLLQELEQLREHRNHCLQKHSRPKNTIPLKITQ